MSPGGRGAGAGRRAGLGGEMFRRPHSHEESLPGPEEGTNGQVILTGRYNPHRPSGAHDGHAGGPAAPHDGPIAAEAHDSARTCTRPEPEPASGRHRRPDRRRGHHRYLPALPRPRGRLLGPAARGGRRRGGDLVLEPVPGGAVRLGELHVRLPVLQGAVRRMGVAGAFRGTARDRALPQPRGGPVRPSAPHPLRDPGHLRRVRRAVGALERHGRRRHRDPGAIPDRRHRRPLRALLPGRARTRGLPRRVVPHGSVAGGTRRLRRQARSRSSAPGRAACRSSRPSRTRSPP